MNPKKAYPLYSGLFLLSVLLCGGILSCSVPAPGSPDPLLVQAVSGGVIERNESVDVAFTLQADTDRVPEAGAFILRPEGKFSRQVKGTVSWKNPFTLSFMPAEPLKPGIRYTALVNPSKLFFVSGSEDGLAPDKIAGPASSFGFRFETAQPFFEVVVNPVKVDAEGLVSVTGTVRAEKNAGPEKIERAFHSPELGKAVWTHENGEHRFSFGPLRREESARTASLVWNGAALGIKDKGFSSVLIPGSDLFEAVDFRQENGFVEVAFSAPLKPDQDLRGFVSLSGNTDVRYSLEGNVIRIYGEKGANGAIPPGTELSIQDLPDSFGRVLAQPVQYRTSEKWELPEVRFAGQGTILPTSQGSSMVIETRNLSGVMVEAFRIYGDNMIQFLQVNNLDGKRELDRVGEPVWAKSFDLSWKDADKNTWKREGLDLSDLAKKYPDSMFHIRLSFRPRHIKYECPAGHGDFSQMRFPGESFQPLGDSSGESSNWDWFNDWDYDGYTYRKDPCHPAFYVSYYDHNITVGQNVLVSDLGLLAKRALDGSWIVSATNLKTAKIEAGADIDVLNYQGRSLFKIKTGTDGIAGFGSAGSSPVAAGSGQGAVPGNTTPAFLAARAAPGRAWLKISDARALTVSHFDISGERPLNGVRGLIYGERGVWRPGDTIYLTFLLADPQRTLPAGHPVSFELEDPRGRITGQRTFVSSVDGFYPAAVSTAADAPTGDWIARVRVGGSVFTKNIKIETVIPNRLGMNLDFGSRDYVESSPTQVSLEAAWLYGAPAPGLKADISVSFSDKDTSFPGYADYSFRDPSRNVSSERQTVWEGTLDASGKSRFSMSLNPGSNVPGKLTARFMTRVFEPSGVFSSEQSSKEFSPYNRYVGLRLPKGDASRNMLLTDTDHRADIMVLGADGKPVQGTVSLECAIYKTEWRWWWEKGGEDAAEFASYQSRTPLSKGTVSAVNGRASWNFRINYPDWGRYLVLVRDSSGGHAAASVVYIDWPGWAGRSTEGAGQGAAAMLVLSPDKTSYSSGDRVAVTFPSNKNATALVALEKSGRLLKQEWISCSDTVTRYEFTADPSMAPNIYVHVTLLQPHLQTANDLPLRLYGITPVMVDDQKTRLAPRISVPANWEPESQVSFSVSEASGRPMAYTVAVVDEGLLGLTRYSLPNPRNTFYSREASFLKSWDLFSEVMGAYSGKLETLLAIGGGDDGEMDGARESQRFKPVVKFFGPYELKANETKNETFTLPPYIGALRVMVLAASSTSENGGRTGAGVSGRAYGTAEQSVTVASDLMVFGTVPRALSPADEAVIPVTVASYKDGARQVQVNFTVAGAVLQSPGSQTVAFEKPGEKTIQFRIKAPNLPGLVKFTMTASSPGLKTARHATDLPVRSTAIPITVSQLKLLSSNETWTGVISYPGMAGTNTAFVEASRVPPLNLETRLEYLIRYPHGCVEQTTSSVFPQLYLDKVMTLSPERIAETRSNVIAGIERLASFQVPGGGFSYWPGDESAHDWGSTYAGHFLIEAKRAGFAVPADLLNQFITFQKNRAAGWASREGNQAEQAYRLYTLALAGEADLGSMNRLRERGGGLDALAGWRLAAAYWYAGQRDTARTLAGQLDPSVRDYRELSGTFGSTLRDKAIILETLTLLGDSARVKPVFEGISAHLSEDRWLSTQETAYALIASVSYMRGTGSGPLNVTASLSGVDTTLAFTTPVAKGDLGNPLGLAGSFTVKNNSSAPAYVRVLVRGTPEEGKEPSISSGLAMTVEYLNSRGARINPDALKDGEDMEIRVTVRNTTFQDVREIALIHPIPASWEIINTRLGEDRPGGGSGSSTGVNYQDIRDDRVMTYFDLGRGSSRTIVLQVNKTYGGSYFRPAIQAYAMYDESIRAVEPGMRR